MDGKYESKKSERKVSRRLKEECQRGRERYRREINI